LHNEFNEYGFKWYGVDTGVPHLVTIVDNLNKFNKDIAQSMRYKYNSNVNFIHILDNNKIQIRTYERGVEDETLACGTGMAAGFLYANNLNLVGSKAFLYPKSKEELILSIENQELYFQGKVTKVFQTDIYND
jgi:diaminopimelate epimerase